MLSYNEKMWEKLYGNSNITVVEEECLRILCSFRKRYGIDTANNSCYAAAVCTFVAYIAFDEEFCTCRALHVYSGISVQVLVDYFIRFRTNFVYLSFNSFTQLTRYERI